MQVWTKAANTSRKLEAKWRPSNLRKQARQAVITIGEHTRCLIDRSCSEPVDKAALLADLQRKVPQWMTIHRSYCTTSREYSHGSRLLAEKSTPEQKMITGLIGFSQMAATANSHLRITDLPMRGVVHDLCVSASASRSLLNMLCGLKLSPTPDKYDKFTDELNESAIERLRVMLLPSGQAEQQMEAGVRLPAVAEAGAANILQSLGEQPTAAAPAAPRAAARAPARPTRQAARASATAQEQPTRSLDFGPSNESMAVDNESSPAGAGSFAAYSQAKADFAAAVAATYPVSQRDGPSAADIAAVTAAAAAANATGGTPLPIGQRIASICTTCVRAWDNANPSEAGLQQRVHDNPVEKDATVGVAIFGHAPLPPNLDSHVPEYLNVTRRAALSRRALIAQYAQHSLAPLAPRSLAPSLPRSLAPSHPLSLAPSLPRF